MQDAVKADPEAGEGVIALGAVAAAKSGQRHSHLSK